jgi:hypothetical protein
VDSFLNHYSGLLDGGLGVTFVELVQGSAREAALDVFLLSLLKGRCGGDITGLHVSGEGFLSLENERATSDESRSSSGNNSFGQSDGGTNDGGGIEYQGGNEECRG